MHPERFHFKHFSVAQNNRVLKVNTDGVLLGAYASVDNCQTILDIGSGTGVIALMQAQKNRSAVIDGVEIEDESFAIMEYNFSHSPWPDRLNAIHCAIQTYKPNKKYDCIVSNPPYFINDLKADSGVKNSAKHSTKLTYSDLVSSIKKLMNDNGRTYLVIPTFNVPVLDEIAKEFKMFITQQTYVSAVEGKSPYICLLELANFPKTMSIDSLTIHTKAGDYSLAFRDLLKDFYLKF